MKTLNIKSTIPNLVKPAFVFLLMIPALSACKKLNLESPSLDREIIIDGNYDDWSGQMQLLEKDKISVGLMNDAEYLYLSLVTNDRQIRSQMMFMGFTLWLDPLGGKKKTFGIRFPIGMTEFGMSMREMREERNQAQMEDIFFQAMYELEILGPDDGDRTRLGVSEIQGLEVKANPSRGSFVYELKLPLKAEGLYNYAINIEPGSLIGIGLETQEMDRGMMGDGMGSGGMGGGRDRIGGGGRRGGGGQGGRGGGMGGSGGREAPQPLKVWAVVQLASE